MEEETKGQKKKRNVDREIEGRKAEGKEGERKGRISKSGAEGRI